MKKVCLVLLSCTAFAANAQSVYKCTNAKGATTYQSTPCTEGESSSAPRQMSPASSKQTVSVLPAGPGERRVQVRYRTNDANAACDGARAMRTAALGAAEAAADADLRNRLDRDVQNACK